MTPVILLLAVAVGLPVAWIWYRARVRSSYALLEAQSLILAQDPSWLTDGAGSVHSRFLPIDTSVNLRDLGGYPAMDGKKVRWGLLYRGGTLNELDPADVERVAALNIKVICDLRTEREAAAWPDRPERFGAEATFLPLQADHGAWRRLMVLLFRPGEMQQLVLETYSDLILELNAGVIGSFLRLAADRANYQMVFHCTAGKDRTGAAAMVLYGLLGVPDEVIIADYSLSNRYNHRFREYVGGAIARFKWLAITVDDMTPFVVADPAVMRRVIAALRAKYGTFENYVTTRCGITPEIINQLRLQLLEE